MNVGSEVGTFTDVIRHPAGNQCRETGKQQKAQEPQVADLWSTVRIRIRHTFVIARVTVVCEK